MNPAQIYARRRASAMTSTVLQLRYCRHLMDTPVFLGRGSDQQTFEAQASAFLGGWERLADAENSDTILVALGVIKMTGEQADWLRKNRAFRAATVRPGTHRYTQLGMLMPDGKYEPHKPGHRPRVVEGAFEVGILVDKDGRPA